MRRNFDHLYMEFNSARAHQSVSVRWARMIARPEGWVSKRGKWVPAVGVALKENSFISGMSPWTWQHTSKSDSRITKELLVWFLFSNLSSSCRFLYALILGRGWWGFHLSERASASLVGDSLTQIFFLKKRRRGNREEERTWEVPSIHQAMQSSARRALRQWQLTNGPTHGGFPRLPPTFSAMSIPPPPVSFPLSPSPLL